MSGKRVTGRDAAPAIACELGGDQPGTQAQRWLRLGRDAGLWGAETPGSLRVRFRDEPGVEQELRALAAVEGSCCAWARWQVHPRRAGSELVQPVSSTPEEAAILHAMFSTGTAPTGTPQRSPSPACRQRDDSALDCPAEDVLPQRIGAAPLGPLRARSSWGAE